MKNFVFYNPTKILFGKGLLNKTGSEILNVGAKKILLLYGRGSIFKNGVYDAVINSLKSNGIDFVEVGGIKPNPTLSKVNEAIEFARRNKVDSILAVGGGSVIDSAKAIAAGYYYHNDVWDFFERKSAVKEALPIFVVLTISATGSEMNSGGVITNEKEQKKWAFGSPLLFPKFSIIDPTVQFSLPWSQTANGVIDAMAHVFELYFNGFDETDIQDEIAEGILRTLIKHSQILHDDPSNYESRSQIAWSATLALNGLNSAGRGRGDWASHMIEHSLSAFYDIAHGEGLGIILPAWMEYLYENDIYKFSRFAEKVFYINVSDKKKQAFEGINELKNFISSLNKPTRLREIGIKEEDIPKIAENASLSLPFGSLKNLTYDDIVSILKLAF
jgi:hypothetical protein